MSRDSAGTCLRLAHPHVEDRSSYRFLTVAFLARFQRKPPRRDRSRVAPPSAVPRPAAPGARRHGRRVPRNRHAARAHGGDQGAGRQVRRRRIREGAVQARSACCGAALGLTQHGHDLRRRRVGRPSVHRHGAPRGRHARGSPEGRRRPGSRRRHPLARPGVERARRRARRGRRPPRRQAGEPAPQLTR